MRRHVAGELTFRRAEKGGEPTSAQVRKAVVLVDGRPFPLWAREPRPMLKPKRSFV